MNLIIKLIIKPLRSLLKLLFNRIFYVALALVVQLSWLLIALFRLMEYSRWVTIGMQVVGFLVVLWIVNKKIIASRPPMMNPIANENTSISGQRIATRMIIMNAIWTFIISVVIRVTRLDTENLSMFSNE